MTPAQWRRVLGLCVVTSAIAIVVDVLAVLVLYDRPAIRNRGLLAFLAINVPILVLVGGYAAGAMRFPRWRTTWAVSLASAMTAISVIVWVQATGTLTSYFITFGVALVPVWRVFVGYTAGVAATLTLISSHLIAVILEAQGLIQPRALFMSPPGQEYELAGYRIVVMSSVGAIYVFAFMASNAIVKHLRAKEEALAEVRREMARVAAGVRHGRLTGTAVNEEYVLGELLGRGGMGEVYKARRISTDERVAVKVLHAHLIDDDTILERFRREAKLADKVPAAFTARIMEVGVDEAHSLHFIAMEYLQGEDLGAFLRRRDRLRMDRLVPLARVIAEALDAAHAAGVVHRDLKPQNVLILHDEDSKDATRGRTPGIRLLDFGVAKLIDGHTVSLTEADVLLGTPGYMAPEQALGRVADVGPAADRFALASMLYRAITGRPPFEAPELVLVLNKIASAHPPSPSFLVPSLPSDVDAVFAVAMAKDPSKRYATCTEMIDDLERAEAGELAEETWLRAAAAGGIPHDLLEQRQLVPSHQALAAGDTLTEPNLFVSRGSGLNEAATEE